jgi:nucleotide-binding universal stress UspA family protein/DNA-directed RNA polymerase specialized sigma24 family protein
MVKPDATSVGYRKDVVRRHARRVYRVAYRLTGSERAAESLTRDVFLSVFSVGSADRVGVTADSLCRITARLFLDGAPAARGGGARARSRLTLRCSAEALGGDDVQPALDLLAPRVRAALVLRDVEGLSHEATALTIGVDRDAVVRILAHGRTEVQAALLPRRKSVPAHGRPTGSSLPAADPAVPTGGAILVGVSGSAQSWEALAWAAAEADARGLVLRIVHAIEWPPVTADAFGALPVDLAAQARDAGEALLQQAAKRARSVVPGLPVFTVLALDGSVASAILRAGRHDALIVLGRRRVRRRPRWLIARSTATRIVGRAHCPVAIIGLLEPGSGPSSARVAAVVDSGPPSIEALDFAFRAAARRGVGVTILRVGMRGCGGFRLASVKKAVETRRARFPGMDVQEKSLDAPPGAALVAESGGAARVVLGDRSSSHIRRALLTSGPLATGPVVVVRANSKDETSRTE